MHNNEILLELRNVGKLYPCKKKAIIENITFSLYKGEILGIVGRSGCGKTTLLRIIAGLSKQDFGSVITFYKRLGYVFQENRLFSWLSVYKNIEIVAKQFLDKDELDRKIDYFLDIFGLSDYKNTSIKNLSGGMKRRVEFIRALVISPDIILMDEAFSNMDFHLKMKLISFLKTFLKNRNISGIFVSHDIYEVLHISDKIIVLNKKPTTLIKKIDIRKELLGKTIENLEEEILSLLM
jgi:NitT/TauT family transport system ATP-binding protein